MNRTNEHASCKRQWDRGVTILIVAVSMIFILGMAGLGIDLASLYVGRSQAQRAADAAALAGADYLATNCTSEAGGYISQGCQDLAKQNAVAVGNMNLIAGASPKIGLGDIKFISTSANDPQIQVIASRDKAHGNPMPTFFVKIFGIDSANISAKAVAEAYNPSGGTLPVGVKCLKPWLLPNCDPDHTQAVVGGPVNANCGAQAQFVTGPTDSTALVAPGIYGGAPNTGGVQGELITLKSSSPSDASGPSKFYPVFLPTDTKSGGPPPICPTCAKQSGGSGPASGSLYQENIACCNMNTIVCGTNTIQPITGNMVGPTGHGVDCLIHQKGNSGQDIFTLDSSSTPPWTITAGSNYPNQSLVNQPVQNSSSIASIPLYNGETLCPGNSCPAQITVDVVGFLQIFIKEEINGNVSAYVMNVVKCPTGGGGTGTDPGGNDVVADAGSPIAVRLIHP